MTTNDDDDDTYTVCHRVGAIVGLLLLVCASGVLFWNEGRAVVTSMSLDEGLNLCISLDDSVTKPLKKHENKLVRGSFLCFFSIFFFNLFIFLIV